MIGVSRDSITSPYGDLNVRLVSRLKSVIGMGTGAGAYILTRFAVSFSTVCKIIFKKLFRCQGASSVGKNVAMQVQRLEAWGSNPQNPRKTSMAAGACNLSMKWIGDRQRLWRGLSSNR